MIVMKFGGTSVGNAERIRGVADIILSQREKNPAVVVSALGGVTDSLIETANSVANGADGTRKLEEIVQRHYAVIQELGLHQEIIENEVEELRDVIEGVSLLKELTPKTADKLVSFGERMSARIVAGYISKSNGVRARAYDAYDIGLVTDSNFGNSDVLPQAYQRIRKSLAKSRCLPVITGFIGKDRNGSITTLGRGGSDYTASIVGAAVGADEIQIWTDVNGIMTADPRVVRSARNIDVVSYDEASELAFLGAKVLHPKTILPAVNQRIPVRILNTFNPKQKGTTIVKEIKSKSRVASIACKKKIQVINIISPEMFQTHGFLRRIFEVFDNHSTSVDMVSTSEVSISITLDGKNDTDKLIRDLRKLGKIQALSNRAKVSMVGKGMVYIPGIAGRIFTSLDGIEVEMVSSSRSEINQSFVVQEKYADEAVRKLHRRFFGG